MCLPIGGGASWLGLPRALGLSQHRQRHPNLQRPNPAAPHPPSTPTPGAGTGVDIKTFVTAKAPKSDSQFATTVAYYYRFEAPVAQKRDSITSDMLQEAARLTGRNRFPKPIVTLNNAKKSGYLDSGARGEFSVNSVGENLVAMTLPSGPDAGRASTKNRGGTKKARKKSGKA